MIYLCQTEAVKPAPLQPGPETGGKQEHEGLNYIHHITGDIWDQWGSGSDPVGFHSDPTFESKNNPDWNPI